jgi:dihydroneopterin triphosphate diphosphatase
LPHTEHSVSPRHSAPNPPLPHKIPRSVLVVIHTPSFLVLLLERAPWPGYWQSVTGSVERADEPLRDTAIREVAEETGLAAERYALVDWGIENTYEIYNQWRSRYAPGVTHNVEHVFGLTLPEPLPVRLAPQEHSQQLWLPWQAAADKCFSWSNRDAILALPGRAAAGAR